MTSQEEIESESNEDYIKQTANTICEEIQAFSPMVNIYGHNIKLSFFKVMLRKDTKILYGENKETKNIFISFLVKGTKKVWIELNWKDLYDVKIYSTKTAPQKLLKEYNDIFFEQLTDTILEGLKK